MFQDEGKTSSQTQVLQTSSEVLYIYTIYMPNIYNGIYIVYYTHIVCLWCILYMLLHSTYTNYI